MIDLTSEQHNIIDAAFKRFAKFGHENVTMAQIAKDLGYTRTFLYYYFPDKESIYKASLIRRASGYFLAAQKELARPLSGYKKLEIIMRIKIECGRDFYRLGAYTNSMLYKLHIVDKDLQAIYKREHKMIASAISEGIKDGSIIKCNPEKVAQKLVDGQHGYMSVGLRKLEFADKISPATLEKLFKELIEDSAFLVQSVKAR